MIQQTLGKMISKRGNLVESAPVSFPTKLIPSHYDENVKIYLNLFYCTIHSLFIKMNFISLKKKIVFVSVINFKVQTLLI